MKFPPQLLESACAQYIIHNKYYCNTSIQTGQDAVILNFNSKISLPGNVCMIIIIDLLHQTNIIAIPEGHHKWNL